MIQSKKISLLCLRVPLSSPSPSGHPARIASMTSSISFTSLKCYKDNTKTLYMTFKIFVLYLIAIHLCWPCSSVADCCPLFTAILSFLVFFIPLFIATMVLAVQSKPQHKNTSSYDFRISFLHSFDYHIKGLKCSGKVKRLFLKWGFHMQIITWHNTQTCFKHHVTLLIKSQTWWRTKNIQWQKDRQKIERPQTH